MTPFPQPTSQLRRLPRADAPDRHRREGRLRSAADGPQRAVHRRRSPSAASRSPASPASTARSATTARATPGPTALFHANIGAAVPTDCTVCHYPLMADAREVGSDQRHATTRWSTRSAQLTFQNCQTCHTAALAKARDDAGGRHAVAAAARYHPSLATQPTACVDCHARLGAGGQRRRRRAAGPTRWRRAARRPTARSG